MDNRLNAYLTDSNILFNKQFVFRACHSTEHALLELIDQISYSLNDKSYFLGIFIYLSKALDIVDHKILLRKLQHYGIKAKILSSFESYLTGRKQYINFKISDRYGKNRTVRNNMRSTTRVNLFCSSNDIKTLFLNTNLELKKISEWFWADKLSLNEDKTTFTFFHRFQDRDCNCHTV